MASGMHNRKVAAPSDFHRSGPTSGLTNVSTRSNLSVSDLPPGGTSPAVDLQRKLTQAALHGFFTPKDAPTTWGIKRKIAVMVGMAGLGWAVVFGSWVAFS